LFSISIFAFRYLTLDHVFFLRFSFQIFLVFLRHL
jgi:hypothetical protein